MAAGDDAAEEAGEAGEEGEEEEEPSSDESEWLADAGGAGGGAGSGRARSDRLFARRHRQMAAECLDAHNVCRALHCVAPLRLSKKLCRHSKAWAHYLAQTGQMESRYNNPFGENLFLVWPTSPDYVVKGSEPVDHWYSGIRDYFFGCEPRNLLCMHFTQMVWRSTQRLGVGVARAADGKIFVVANYAPRGNIVGQFIFQVPPMTGFPEESASGQELGEGAGSEAEAEAAAEAAAEAEARARMLEDTCGGRPTSAPQREGLLLHNELRRRHNVPLLTLSATLTRRAKAWARQLADEDRHAYMVDNPLGENVFSFVSSDAHVRQRVGVRNAIDAWYAERRLFDYGHEPLDTKARNFTQMIWRSTRLLGLGVARGRGGRVIVVANYYPRGNVVGQYRENVPSPLPVDPAAAARPRAPRAVGDDEDDVVKYNGDDDGSSYSDLG